MLLCTLCSHSRFQSPSALCPLFSLSLSVSLCSVPFVLNPVVSLPLLCTFCSHSCCQSLSALYLLFSPPLSVSLCSVPSVLTPAVSLPLLCTLCSHSRCQSPSALYLPAYFHRESYRKRQPPSSPPATHPSSFSRFEKSFLGELKTMYALCLISGNGKLQSQISCSADFTVSVSVYWLRFPQRRANRPMQSITANNDRTRA